MLFLPLRPLCVLRTFHLAFVYCFDNHTGVIETKDRRLTAELNEIQIGVGNYFMF